MQTENKCVHILVDKIHVKSSPRIPNITSEYILY
jgi:hypothetical protein